MPIEPPAVNPVVTGQTQPASKNLATQLPDTPCRTCSIKARHANAGIIYVGGAGVAAATGYHLNKDDSIDLSVDNTNMVYVLSDTNGDGVTWIVLD